LYIPRSGFNFGLEIGFLYQHFKSFLYLHYVMTTSVHILAILLLLPKTFEAT